MTEELLALLEEGPQAAAALARWLQRPRIEVAHHLRRMATDGHVKQVGTAKQWALATFTPTLGRKPTLDREAICSSVLWQIPPGILRTTQELRVSLRLSRQAVLRACATLVDRRLLEQHGTGSSVRWSRPGVVMPAPAPLEPPVRAAVPVTVVPAAKAAHDDEGDELDEPITDWPTEEIPDDVELGLAPAREPVSRSGAPLRQPHERPASQKVAKDEEPSFWVNCDRAELNRRIAARQELMRNSKAARFIDGSVRNY